MKSEITIYCNDEAELQEFARRILSSEPKVQIQIHKPTLLTGAQELQGPTPGVSGSTGDVQPQPVTRQRKPRSDAGQPRGPYKTTEPTTGGPAASASDNGGSAAATPPTSAASASPTTSPAPAAPAVQPHANPQPTPPAVAEPGKELTLDDARAALKRMSDTKGLGMDACMGHLAKFGVSRISLLPKAEFAEFIKSADDMIACQVKENAAGAKK